MVAAEAASCGAFPLSAGHSGMAEVTAALAPALPRSSGRCCPSRSAPARWRRSRPSSSPGWAPTPPSATAPGWPWPNGRRAATAGKAWPKGSSRRPREGSTSFPVRPPQGIVFAAREGRSPLAQAPARRACRRRCGAPAGRLREGGTGPRERQGAVRSAVRLVPPAGAGGHPGPDRPEPRRRLRRGAPGRLQPRDRRGHRQGPDSQRRGRAAQCRPIWSRASDATDVAAYVAYATSRSGEDTGALATAGLEGATSGKQIFVAAGCGSCHVFADAGTNGNVGPSLDELASAAGDRVRARPRSTSRSRSWTRTPSPWRASSPA